MSEEVKTTAVEKETEKVEVKKPKLWSQMTAAEKVKAMPEYKKTVQNQIAEYKKKLANEKRKLKSLENEEKALKYEVLEQKARSEGKRIEDLI